MEEQSNETTVPKHVMEALKHSGIFNKKVEDVKNIETNNEIPTEDRPLYQSPISDQRFF